MYSGSKAEFSLVLSDDREVEAGEEVYRPKLALGVHGVDRGRSWSRRCAEDPIRVQCTRR